MNKVVWLKGITLSILIGTVAAFGGSKLFTAMAVEPADKSDGPPPHVMCYEAAVVEPIIVSPEEQIKSLKESLKELDRQYKEKKISKETYETRLETIMDQINTLENEVLD